MDSGFPRIPILNDPAQDSSPGLLGRDWCLNGDGVVFWPLARRRRHTPRKWTEADGRKSDLEIGKLWSSSAFLCDLRKLTLPLWALFSPGVTEEEQTPSAFPISKDAVNRREKQY